MSAEAALQHCAELVERGDPDRFRAIMAAPLRARRVMFPLAAFSLEVARVPWLTKEEMIAEMRLQWWRDALEEIQKGGWVRRHDVITPVAEAVDGPAIAALDQMIVARRWDIYKEPFEDEAYFAEYIAHTSGHLYGVMARALALDYGIDPAEIPEAVLRDFSYGAGVANFLRAVPALEAAGRIPMLDGRPEALRFLAQNALDRLRHARRLRRRVPDPVVPVMVMGWQADGILRRAITRPELVATGDLAPSDFGQRIGLLWRSVSGRW